tara:strand:- start:325 stop:558 length:234 start_codon:yes stop_codon:yes gene_type:complete
MNSEKKELLKELGEKMQRYHYETLKAILSSNYEKREALKEKGVELEVIKFTDPDDDFNEPLPERTCNLDDESCESCQ